MLRSHLYIFPSPLFCFFLFSYVRLWGGSRGGGYLSLLFPLRLSHFNSAVLPAWTPVLRLSSFLLSYVFFFTLISYLYDVHSRDFIVLPLPHVHSPDCILPSTHWCSRRNPRGVEGVYVEVLGPNHVYICASQEASPYTLNKLFIYQKSEGIKKRFCFLQYLQWAVSQEGDVDVIP